MQGSLLGMMTKRPSVETQAEKANYYWVNTVDNVIYKVLKSQRKRMKTLFRDSRHFSIYDFIENKTKQKVFKGAVDAGLSNWS